MLEDLEYQLVLSGRSLSGSTLYDVGKNGRVNIRLVDKTFVLWYGKLFRRSPRDLVLVSSMGYWVKKLCFFHENLGHWDVETTKKFFHNRFW